MKMQFFVRSSLYFAVVQALFSTVAFADAQPTRLMLATAYSADSFMTQNIQQFAAEINKATNGSVDIEVRPAGRLLKPAAIFEGVKSGDSAQAGEVIMSSLTKESVIFGLDTLPFFVNSYEDAQRLWRISRPAIEKTFDSRGLVLLYAAPWPPQNLYANRVIGSPADFKGLRMRDYNSATERIAQIVGATPIKIETLDLENAIADGKVDIMLTSSWTGGDAKAWSNMKYYYKVNAWIPKNIVFMNKAVFEKFDSATQKKITAAAEQAEKRGWQLCKEKDSEFEAQLVSHKVQVREMDIIVRNFLDNAGEKMAREYLKSGTPADAQSLVQILVQYTIGQKK